MEIFKIFGTIALSGADEAKKDISGVAGAAESASQKLGTAFSKIGDCVVAVGKTVAAGIAAGSAAIASLTKEATEAYAEYEQLVGGAELMFGEGFDYIAEKAKTAYKDVQMSQNDYLEQVNGFAVGLKTALDGNGQAAAELADRIIQTEADIVAATGNSQEAVQNAFNGIMKNNFSMLDNLGLGITATKEGMEQVIDTVNKWNKANGKSTKYTINNIADCQKALLDYVEMQGMAGYAANEAAGTISGSLAMTKAAWEDLLVGMADDQADFESLINNLVDSVGIAAENIIPRIETALVGAGKLVDKLVPIIIEKIPQAIQNFLPQIVQSAVSIVQSLVDGLQSNSKMLADTTISLCETIFFAIISMLPQIIELGVSLVVSLAEGIANNVSQIVSAVQTLVSKIFEILTNGDTIGKLLNAALVIIVALAGGLVEFLPELVASAVSVIQKIVEVIVEPATLDLLLEAALAVILAIADGLMEFATELTGAATEVIVRLVEFLLTTENLSKIIDAAVTLLTTLAMGIAENVGTLLESAGSIVATIVEGVLSTDWAQVGASIVAGIGEGLVASWENLVEESPVGAEILTNVGNALASGGVGDSLVGTVNPTYDAALSQQTTATEHQGGGRTSHASTGSTSSGKNDLARASMLARGGVLKRGQVGLLEGSGAEAVVPLENNRAWISRVAADMNSAFGDKGSKQVEELKEAFSDFVQVLPDMMVDAFASMKFDVNNREFARMVKAVN